jgi:hypothetical protein
MDRIEALLDEVYIGQERVSRDEIYRRAVAADLPGELITALDTLPEGEYAQDEVVDALGEATVTASAGDDSVGVDAGALDDADVLRELAELYRTRLDTLRHGSDQALARHTGRMAELEAEYLRRTPDREVDPERLREGARQRTQARVRPVEDSTAAVLAADDEAPLEALSEGGGAPQRGTEFIEPTS